jgi:hypothetical protein
MQCVFSVLGAVASGYTFTHMVAGDVTDPCERRRCSLFKTASLRAPWSTDKANDNIPASNDNHCDNDTTARDASHRSRVHTKASKGLSITWATCSARHTTKASEHKTLSTNDTKATFIQATTMRLRGSGGESQEELDALETLSHNGGATFKRILRKLLLWTYHEEISITEALDNNSLQKINSEIDDDDVGDDVWYTYGADIIWAEEDDDDQQYNESEDYDDDDDDDDEYYDAGESEWAEGQILVGSLKIWNQERNYGVIVVLDDYTTREMGEGQIFCHGTNFSDDEETTDMYVDGQLVWFTVAWDNTRKRWQAINISLATYKEYTAFEEENSMSEEASEFFVDCVIGQAYDGI